MKIILASSSPRRKEILEKTGLEFVVLNGDYEEDMTLDIEPSKLVEYLSLGKALAVSKGNVDSVVISADTIVSFENHVLGKPKNEEEAVKMLQMLRGKENDIITGVTIVRESDNKKVSFHEITKVFMKNATDDEIDRYVKTGEPMDKAGAYAIQGKGSVFIDHIEGDFYNAVGLPIRRLVDELKKFGVEIF